MKKIGILIVIFTMMVALFSSCKKDDDNGDGTVPVIVIQGFNPLYWVLDYPYDDPGATAYDVTSQGDTVDITSRIQTSSNVNVALKGEYEVKYNVTDESGVAAEEKVRKVTVVIGK